MFKRLFAFVALITCMDMASVSAYGTSTRYYPRSCCDPCDSCCDRFWLDADYLYWQIQACPEPVPLVVVAPSGDTGTAVLGGKDTNHGWRSGAGFALGYWFDPNECLGGEVNYFFVGDKSTKSTFSSSADGEPRARIPFFNVLTGLPDSVAFSTPGVFMGTGTLRIKNGMQGAELNVLGSFPRDVSMSFGMLVGVRWWNFDERLKFNVSSPFVAPTPVDVWLVEDRFHAQNNFYGGQIGLSFNYDYCSFFFNVEGKVAIGAMLQEANINGSFQTNEFTDFTAIQDFVGGYFALPTNIGHHKKRNWSVLPQIDVNLGYDFTDCFRIQVGYSALYVCNVLRAGKLISGNINPTQSAAIEFTPTPVLVGEKAPKDTMKTSGLWAQGASIGFEYRF